MVHRGIYMRPIFLWRPTNIERTMTLLKLYILAACAGALATVLIACIQYGGELRAAVQRWSDERRSRRRHARARRRLGRG